MSLRLRARLILLAVLVLVVGGGGSPAHALVKPPLIDGERLLGGVVKTGKGVGRFGRLVPGPVGAILGAGTLAWWAYNEFDMKANAPQPGGTATDWLGASVNYPTSNTDARMSATITSVSGRAITMDISCLTPVVIGTAPNQVVRCGSTTNSAIQIGTTIGSGTGATNPTYWHSSCKNTTTNVITDRVNLGLWQKNTYLSGTSIPTTSHTSNVCNSGEVVLGFAISGDGYTPSTSLWEFHSPIGWGTLQGSTLPTGELTFATAVVDVTCRNGVTGATQHIVVTSEWGPAEQLSLPSCKQRLGDDWYGIGVKVIPMDPEIDDVPLDPEIWPDWDVPDFVPEEWTEDELTPDEESDPCHGTSKGCGLSIRVDGDIVTPGTMDGQKLRTIVATQPERVECRWGTKEVDWKYCVPILGTFDSPTGVTTTDPTKPTHPTEPEVPVTGTGSQPVPTDAQGCMAAAFSWNPVDWVFVPVKCALQWAFKPTTAFSTRIGRVKTAFESKPPFSWLASLSSLPSVGGAGCPTNWQFAYKGESYPVLCGTAMGNGLHAFRPTMVILLVGAAVYPFLRALVYAAFPIIKPTPHD